jgi:outer membrane beta-barrel protein
MTLSLDEVIGDGVQAAPADGNNESDSLEFDVVDTEQTVRAVEAQKKAEQDLIRVIQRRPFLRRRRFELAPGIATNINDSLVSFFMAGGSATYHLTEVMAIGASGSWALGSETDLFDQVITDYDVFPEISKIQWSASLDFQYAFMYGKFALFNTWIIPWDTYAILGAGATQTQLATHPILNIGIGQRYFMNRWFTLNLSLRDGVYNEDYPGGSQIVNNLVFSAGVSFFLPPNFEYRMLK